MNDDRCNVLIIGAHPDDEILGCGGTAALHVSEGHRVTAVIACEGTSVRYSDRNVDQARHATEAAKMVGIEESIQLGFADQKLDTYPLLDITQALEEVVARVRPTVVYCQYGGDVNRDHHILFQATLVATRPLVQTLRAVYAFDTASSTEWGFPRSFVPDTWVDISSTLDQKLRAMACYETEVQKYPHPRSLTALANKAKAWGNQVACDAAEVFLTVRRVTRRGPPPV